VELPQLGDGKCQGAHLGPVVVADEHEGTLQESCPVEAASTVGVVRPVDPVGDPPSIEDEQTGAVY
jgi:hypothetical protein